MGGNKMLVSNDIDFEDLLDNCWAVGDTLEVISNNNKEFEFMDLLEEQFCAEIPTMTEINDFIRFESDYIFTALGI